MNDRIEEALRTVRVAGSFHATEEGERDLHYAARVLENEIEQLRKRIDEVKDAIGDQSVVDAQLVKRLLS